MTEQMEASVPSIEDPQVQNFIDLFRMTCAPVHLKYVDRGYHADFCHLSAKHCAMTNGGRRVHGWALWSFGAMVVGEHHSVWESPESDLVDVTPPKFGADHILFIRDDTADLVEMGGVYVMWADRTTIPGIPFGFQGQPHTEPNWGLPPNNTNLNEFCDKFGLKPSDILTDERFG